ncbi:MAG: lipopolysaccharide export system protein LptA [Gammaproteobacteria bacterium]|jgi:lipopolysaccharide export system protein LptA|nr:lipopolysaccharide export system protein LptA [Gammaproteobacteria bacterium]
MAVSNLKSLVLLAFTMSAAEVHGAAAPQQAIALDAQSSELDLRSNNVVFRKVHIAQGAMAVSADVGSATKQATGLDFDNSLWIFRGNVKITMDDGELTSDDAEINFAKKALAKALVNGKPAAFEQRVAKTGKVAHGRADTIDYDARKGIVRLSKNAWLSDGQTEIRGESLKYDVLAQSIVAESSEQGSQRVHIIITPPPSKP